VIRWELSHSVHISVHRFKKNCLEEAYNCLGKGERGRVLGGGGVVICEGSVW
jgi:hypothetical protein